MIRPDTQFTGVGDDRVAYQVLVTSTVKDLVTGSGIPFEDHGSHALKGVPGEWRPFVAEK